VQAVAGDRLFPTSRCESTASERLLASRHVSCGSLTIGHIMKDSTVKQSLSKVLRAALIALGIGLGAGLGAVGPAQAALWTGAWDPRYGQPFDANFDADVLGWRGVAVFEIPDACIVVGTVSSASCTGMELVNAQVTFYDFLTNATVETFDYAPSDLSSFTATFGAGGVLTSLVSDYFAPRSPVSDFSVINLYTFSLQFVEDGVRMYHTKDYDLWGYPVGPYSPEHCESYWLLRLTQPWVCGYSGTYSDGTSAPAIVVTYTKVPEPGSLALLLAAGMAGLTLRIGRTGRRAV
jgi:hypothetical protein